MLQNKNKFFSYLNGASALVISATLATPIAAQEIRLRSSDSSVNLVGDLIEYIDNRYIIRTALGDLQISAELVNCEGDACPQFGAVDANVTIVGSEVVSQGVMPLLLEGYAGANDALGTITTTNNSNEFVANLVANQGFGDELGAFLVQTGDSDAAFSALLDSSASIGMSSRRITPEEAKSLGEAGAGNMVDPSQERIIATDNIVLITHPNNPINDLTVEQVASIYSGDITNWSEVGGVDQPIVVYSATDKSSTRSVFDANIFGNSELTPSATIETLPSNNDIAASVNANEAAIGYVSYAFQRGAKPITLTNECGLSIIPDVFSARTEEYPLLQRLYLYSRADNEEPLTGEFLDYVVSEDADSLITKAGFINFGLALRKQPRDGVRATALQNPVAVEGYEADIMNDMVEAMSGYDRLSTTFRFRTASSQLNPRGLFDMRRLVSYLESQPENTKVRFVGFTDSVGSFDSNINLSKDRAKIAMTGFEEFAGDRIGAIEIDHVGFGPIAPTGCNVSDTGRGINRRVEVWINKGI